MKDSYVKRFGFQTNSRSRPEILANLKQIFREDLGLIKDEDTLKEALTFVNINGKPQASEGQHDDLIMGLAIAYEALKQIPLNITKKPRRDPDQDFFDYGG